MCRGIIPSEDKYYKDFSKFMLQTKSSSDKHLTPIYNYEKWLSDPKSINALSLRELKRALKNDNQLHSKNKPFLKARLENYYTRIKSAIKIQSAFRRYVVVESERLKGPGYKCRDRCVNDADFNTMDELRQVPLESFFSYVNDQGFIYGFNIFSLINMFKCSRKFENPYTRENIPVEVIYIICSLYTKIKIIYPLVFSRNRVCGAEELMNDVCK